MPSSVTIVELNPHTISDVLGILQNVNENIIYDAENELSIYIKEYSEREGYFFGKIFIQYLHTIKNKNLVDGEITQEDETITDVLSIDYAYFPTIECDSGRINHVIIFLSPEFTVRLLSTVLSQIIRGIAFNRLEFNFTSSNEVNIRNHFDDILKIRGEEILDASITDLSIRGTRLFESDEYQKVLTGEIRYYGVPLGDTWFIIHRTGKITTYHKLPEDDIIARTKRILEILICAGVISN